MNFAISGKPALVPLSSGPAQENYQTSVAGTTSSVTITPSTEDANSTVVIAGETVANKTASSPIQLTTATTLVSMTVTAQDGTSTRTYSVAIMKQGSNNANIGIKLTPTSKLAGVNTGPAMYNYKTSVDPLTQIITVKATAEEPNATLTIDGNTVSSGAAVPIALNASGVTNINLVSIAQNGVTIKTYSIAVYKDGSNNADIDLRLSPAAVLSLAPSGPDLVNYQTTVPFSQTSLKIVPTAANGKSTIRIDGQIVANKTPSQAIALTPGTTTLVRITNTAQDNITVRTISIAVITEAAPPLRMAAIKITTEETDAEETAIEIGNALSPNSDGINDYLAITGIEAYPANKLTIMNSKGVYVNDISNYDNTTNAFGGYSKGGALLPQGTYFYLLDYTTKAGLSKRKSGYVVLKY
ncbi:MAG: hypothetical protein EOP54_16115, partial [Sphingobacteriales bacterium]